MGTKPIASIISFAPTRPRPAVPGSFALNIFTAKDEDVTVKNQFRSTEYLDGVDVTKLPSSGGRGSGGKGFFFFF